MSRRYLGGILAAALLLSGCAAIPGPQEAMRPVVTDPGPAAPPGGAPSAEPAAPTLLWHAATQGKPHRLWWGGELLLAAGLTGDGDRFLDAVDARGEVRWRLALASAWLVDAAVDDRSVAHLLVAEGSGRGNLISLGVDGAERLRLPWQEGWPRTIRAGGGGECLAIGFDGQSGAFTGRLRFLAADGTPLIPDRMNPLTGFTGFPSADCRRVLLGYEGGSTGLYPNDLYPGSGLRLIDAAAGGEDLWALIDYHRPLALSADGGVAVALGVPSPDRAYQPPRWDTEPAPPYGQVLWLGEGGEILDRYRIPYPAQVDGFRMTPDALESLLLLTSHRFTGGGEPEVFRRAVWLSRRSGRIAVRWEQLIRGGRVVDLQLIADGSAALVATESRVSVLGRDGELLWAYEHGAPIAAARLSPDGRRMAVLAADGLWFFALERK